MQYNLTERLFAGRRSAQAACRFDGEDWLSTAELLERSGHLAGALRQAGIGRGDLVSFRLEKSSAVLLLTLACYRLGATIHALNTAYTEAELAVLLADARPKALIVDPEGLARFEPLAAAPRTQLLTLGPQGQGSLGAAAAAADIAPIAEVGAGDIAALLYTSGTTGRPKGARITYGNLARSAEELAQLWRITETDRLLHILPMYHAHGLLTSVNVMLAGGGAIRFVSQFTPEAVAAELGGASVLMAVPTHYTRLLKLEDLGRLTGALRLAISGSAPLPAEIARQFAEATGHTIIERYGATETAIVTAMPAGTADRQGSVGRAVPGVELRLRGTGGDLVPLPGEGRLETRGHNVFAGYLNRPDADAESITPDGWFRTGDLAAIDAEGWVRLLGRDRDLIITGGLNVYPAEVENALEALIAADGACAVIGLPHPDFGEGVVAVVENAPVDETALIAALRQRLAPYKLPKRIIATDVLPRNTMGKILKSKLRENLRDLFQAKDLTGE